VKARRLVAGLVVAVASVTASAFSPAYSGVERTAGSALAFEEGQEPGDCTQIPPDRTPLPSLQPGRARLVATVLVEHADAATARKLFESTARAYATIGVRIEAKWDVVTRFRVANDLDGRFARPETLLDAMRRRYDGRRPAGSDVVYLFTRQHPGGFADCIGGVLRPDRGFAFGAIALPPGVQSPTEMRPDVLAAHEIAHLLGAQHHYATCVEAVPATVTGSRPGCTVMFPLVALATNVFGVIESTYIHDTLSRRKATR
jgi:hypothetical protein